MKIESVNGQLNAVETEDRATMLIKEIERKLVAKWFGVQEPDENMIQKWVFKNGPAFEAIMFSDKSLLVEYSEASEERKGEIVEQIERLINDGAQILAHEEDDRLDKKPTLE